MKQQSVFKAMADPTRRKILQILRAQDSLCAGDIGSHFTISAPAISEHLRILLAAGLVRRQRQGKYIHYHLNTSIFEDIASYCLQLTDRNKEASE